MVSYIGQCVTKNVQKIQSINLESGNKNIATKPESLKVAQRKKHCETSCLRVFVAKRMTNYQTTLSFY